MKSKWGVEKTIFQAMQKKIIFFGMGKKCSLLTLGTEEEFFFYGNLWLAKTSGAV